MFNVTRIAEQVGDEQYFITKEMGACSKFRITMRSYDKIAYDRQDFMVIPGPSIARHEQVLRIIAECNKRKIKVIMQYVANVNIVYSGVDLVITCTPPLYLWAKKNYKEVPVVFLPQSIDVNYFQPDKIYQDKFMERRRFVVGTTEDLGLKFPTLLRPNFIVKDSMGEITQDHLKQYYQSLDCFVTTENNSRIILEAIACGIPVITKEQGASHLLLPDEYIFKTKKEMITLLETFHREFELRDGLSKVNRAWAETIWDWSNNIKLWDDALFLAATVQIPELNEMTESLIAPFAKYFKPCDQYDEEIAYFAQLKLDHTVR